MTMKGPQSFLDRAVRRFSRREWLYTVGASGVALTGCSRQKPPPLPADLQRFPQKVGLLVLNDRSPCLETPWRYFREDLTPNDAFYVRWHLQAIPTTVDLRTWRLNVGGHVEKPLTFTMDELRGMEAESVVAVNQCSGNSRSLFSPRVPGGQWGNGAMGNARWTGVPLRTLVRRAGVKAGAVQISFDGLDEGGMPAVPDYIKSLDVDVAQEPDVLVAYEMNGQPLPMLNGFPARLVVPGWYATYWIKALTQINVLDKPFEGFWMAKGYRIPTTEGAAEDPKALAQKTIPINRMNIRSFMVRPEADETVPAGRVYPMEGIAFDGGAGIKMVEVSADGGNTWQEAKLDGDLGRYSFRRWRWAWTPATRGSYRLQVRATSNAGETQPTTPRWNRAGYMRNIIEEITVAAI
jgi:sulfite dehydrogenase